MGVFEDLQTLIVVLAGISILLVSTLFNWGAISATEQEQDLYNEAEHLVKQIESNPHLRAYNYYGGAYTDFMLKQTELGRLQREGGFSDVVRSDLHYNITFDDLVIGPGDEVYDQENKTTLWFDVYGFGDPSPSGKETAVLTVQYSLVMDRKMGDQDFDVSIRHPCLVTVEVWR